MRSLHTPRHDLLRWRLAPARFWLGARTARLHVIRQRRARAAWEDFWRRNHEALWAARADELPF